MAKSKVIVMRKWKDLQPNIHTENLLSEYDL